MTRFRRNVMWLTLLVLALLMLFSMYGAFLGASAAQSFFNSLPLTVYWIALAVLLAVGIIFFRRLLRTPALLLIHVGCISIIAAAMWGSEGGHHLQKELFGTARIHSGTMIIYEGMKEDRVIQEGADLGAGLDEDGSIVYYEGHGSHGIVKDNDSRLFKLPFYIKLNDFRMDYYDTPRLLVMAEGEGQTALGPIKKGVQFELKDGTTITILQIYGNLKMRRVDGKMEAYDYEGPGSNPALRVQVTYPDGTREKQYAFSGFMGQMGSNKRFTMIYQTGGMVRDYYSDLAVVKDGKVVLEKTIEVNKPLYYDGYHFYQSSYDARGGRYTVLSVTSDSGLMGVFLGYFLVSLGVVWHMWISPVIRQKNRNNVPRGGRHGN